MEIFTLNKTDYKNGKVVNGIKTKLWVERYRSPGEFKFTGSPSEDLMTQLPLGSLISHVDSSDVMMVESHAIQEDKENGPELTISGRSLAAFFDYRVSTPSNAGIYSPSTGDATQYEFLSTYATWTQLVQLLQEQFSASAATWNVMIDIPSHVIRTTITRTETLQTDKISRIGPLSKGVYDFLDFIGAGLKVERPNSSHSSTLDFVVHEGVDKTTLVRFDWALGDISSANYLWSNKTLYNGFRVRGKYYSSTVYPSGLTGFDVRMKLIDAEDIDDDPTSMSGPQLTVLTNKLNARGYAEINRNKLTSIVDAKIATTAKSVYRRDYQIGDRVYVVGNYGVSSPMRVTEYAETEDESGESGFPTLSIL